MWQVHGVDDEGERIQNTLEGLSMRQKFTSYVEDIIYLSQNKSYILSTLAFTSLTFCTGVLSWWGPHFIEDGLQVRIDSGLNQPSDLKVERYV